MAASRSDAEFEALRATIRERGGQRITIFWLTLVLWVTAIAVGPRDWTNPLGTLVPLVLLVAGFESIFALHVSVERIGRYLQVFHETPGVLPAWERAVMAAGQQTPRDPVDPLFVNQFALINVLNFAPALIGQPTTFMVAALVIHILFALRLLQARRFGATQRAADLQRFEAVRARLEAPASEGTAPGTDPPAAA